MEGRSTVIPETPLIVPPTAEKSVVALTTYVPPSDEALTEKIPEPLRLSVVFAPLPMNDAVAVPSDEIATSPAKADAL